MIVPFYLGFFFNRGAEKQPDTTRHISKEKKTRMQINPTTYKEIAR